MDAILELPDMPGAYWYWCEKRQDFRVCDVIEKEGQMRARFTDGSFQRFCGDKSYFVGPINKPVSDDSGRISTAR